MEIIQKNYLKENIRLESNSLMIFYPWKQEPEKSNLKSLNSEHLLFDLIYNPSETSFMIRGKEMGATVSSGLVMLEQQAERAWEIWNS